MAAGIGPRIRAVRQAQGMTLQDLAERIPPERRPQISTLSRMETGKQPIGAELLGDIARGLGRPVAEFYGEAAG